MAAPPTLILLCGLPGSGKTTLAKRLEKELPAVRLCPDEWILELLEDASDVVARDRLRDPVERLQWSHAQKLLLVGVSVILRNGFWSRTERISFAQNAALPGAEVELYYLTTPKEELWRRLELRNQTVPPGSFPVSQQEVDLWWNLLEEPDSLELKY